VDYFGVFLVLKDIQTFLGVLGMDRWMDACIHASILFIAGTGVMVVYGHCCGLVFWLKWSICDGGVLGGFVFLSNLWYLCIQQREEVYEKGGVDFEGCRR